MSDQVEQHHCSQKMEAKIAIAEKCHEAGLARWGSLTKGWQWCKQNIPHQHQRRENLRKWLHLRYSYF